MTTVSRTLLGDRKFFSWIESIVTVLGSLLLLFLVFISLVSSTFLFEVRDLRCSVQDYKEKANVNSYPFQLKGKKEVYICWLQRIIFNRKYDLLQQYRKLWK